ncbi:MAG: hypothetical protein FRX48_09100 [Lasallia pustulata]|uniref:AAA domain-containing protein n=1 Tax=Lasallia pustulata TaxID=136370 RepID=A0A5M8PDR0_9LECA|nr:MAG: hypothetical protein FRX48_09100 [Lasallia pustulata]
MVTSAQPGEGKSLTAAELARSLARSGKQVILVDADMREPVQNTLFDDAPSAGLIDVLSGKVLLDDALASTETPNLSVLFNNAPRSNSADIIVSPHMTNFLQMIRSRADVVVLDTPSCTFVDPLLLAPSVDYVLQVIDLGRANEDAVNSTSSVLSGLAPLGLFINRTSKKNAPAYEVARSFAATLAPPSLSGGTSKPSLSADQTLLMFRGTSGYTPDPLNGTDPLADPADLAHDRVSRLFMRRLFWTPPSSGSQTTTTPTGSLFFRCLSACFGCGATELLRPAQAGSVGIAARGDWAAGSDGQLPASNQVHRDVVPHSDPGRRHFCPAWTKSLEGDAVSVWFLLFAAPIPNSFLGPLTGQIQGLSCTGAAMIMSTLGYPVIQHANVLDVPGASLEVATACSGFHKLISLLAFAAIYGHLFLNTLGKRSLLILLAVPIALLVNRPVPYCTACARAGSRQAAVRSGNRAGCAGAELLCDGAGRCRTRLRLRADSCAASPEAGRGNVPGSLGAWQGGAIAPVDPEIQARLRTSSIMDREYTNRSAVGGRHAGHGLRQSGHPQPKDCFPSQGWKLTNSRDKMIGGQRVTLMDGQLDDQKMTILYWMTGVYTPPAPRSLLARQALSLRDRIVPRHEAVSLFVRLMVPQSPDADPEITRWPDSDPKQADHRVRERRHDHARTTCSTICRTPTAHRPSIRLPRTCSKCSLPQERSRADPGPGDAEYAKLSSRPNFAQALAQSGIQEADFKENLRSSSPKPMSFQGVTATDADAQAYYKAQSSPANPTAQFYPRPRSVCAIATLTQPQAQKALAELASGHAVRAGGQHYSLDTSRTNGGLLPAVVRPPSAHQVRAGTANFRHEIGDQIGPIFFAPQERRVCTEVVDLPGVRTKRCRDRPLLRGAGPVPDRREAGQRHGAELPAHSAGVFGFPAHVKLAGVLAAVPAGYRQPLSRNW